MAVIAIPDDALAPLTTLTNAPPKALQQDTCSPMTGWRQRRDVQGGRERSLPGERRDGDHHRTPLGTLISVRVTVMDGTSLLIQQRLFELSGHAITGTKQSTVRLPNGKGIDLRNDVLMGKLLIRFRLHILQPIDAYDPPHPDDVEPQGDNDIETTIVPVEQRYLFHLPS